MAEYERDVIWLSFIDGGLGQPSRIGQALAAITILRCRPVPDYYATPSPPRPFNGIDSYCCTHISDAETPLVIYRSLYRFAA